MFNCLNCFKVVQEETKEATATTSDSQPDSLVRIVELFLTNMADHDFDRALSYCADHCEIKFTHTGVVMTAVEYFDACKYAVKSFPDIRYAFLGLKELSGNRVFLEFLQISGTHTGEPYAIENHPPVLAQGKTFQNDPEYVVFHLNERGLITEMIIRHDETKVQHQIRTGVTAIYSQIGGTL